MNERLEQKCSEQHQKEKEKLISLILENKRKQKKVLVECWNGCWNS
ncbi:MAG: hypothetical protein P1U39_00655 [Legionellaceae bacterium]|nr:hypothetical protein [Legionellaceae bacterium]